MDVAHIPAFSQEKKASQNQQTTKPKTQTFETSKHQTGINNQQT